MSIHAAARLDLATVKTRLAAVSADLRSLGVTGLTIFGSVARGDAGPGSDLDVMIATREPILPARNYFQIEDIISAAVGAPVGLVTETGADGRLRDEIARDGVEAPV
jgi:hypothetical protein